MEKDDIVLVIKSSTSEPEDDLLPVMFPAKKRPTTKKLKLRLLILFLNNYLIVMCIIFRFDNLESYLNNPEYYDNNKKLPILERISHEKRHDLVHNIISLLLHPNLQSSTFACSTVTTFVSDNVSFVDSLDDSRDVLADDMGSWRNNGIHTTYFNVRVSSIKAKDITICSLDEATIRFILLTTVSKSSLHMSMVGNVH